MAREPDELTPREEQFCLVFVAKRKKKQAAIEAGYSQKTAHAAASNLLTRPRVQRRIEELQADIVQTLGITAMWGMDRLKQIVDRCMEVEPVFDVDGEETGTFKFDARGATSALKVIGEHLGWFVQKHEVDVKEKSVGEIMSEIYHERKRRGITGGNGNGKQIADHSGRNRLLESEPN